MFDLNSASKSSLVALIQAINAINQVDGKAASTLLRVKKEILVEEIETFLEGTEGYILSENGELCEIPSEVEDDDGCDLVSDPEMDEAFAVQPGEDSVGDAIHEEVTEAKPGRRSSHDDADMITVTAEKWTGRDGSASLGRRQLLRSGQTVGEFVAAVSAATGDESGARRTIRKALRKGWIVVTKAGE